MPFNLQHSFVEVWFFLTIKSLYKMSADFVLCWWIFSVNWTETRNLHQNYYYQLFCHFQEEAKVRSIIMELSHCNRENRITSTCKLLDLLYVRALDIWCMCGARINLQILLPALCAIKRRRWEKFIAICVIKIISAMGGSLTLSDILILWQKCDEARHTEWKDIEKSQYKNNDDICKSRESAQH